MAIDNNVLILDGDLPADITLDDGVGQDIYVVQNSLSSNLIISDTSIDGNIIQFDRGVKVTSMLTDDGQPPLFLLLYIEDASGVSHTIQIDSPTHFQYRLGSDGELLNFEQLYIPDYSNGFVVDSPNRAPQFSDEAHSFSLQENQTNPMIPSRLGK